jgi:hypothetical protein
MRRALTAALLVLALVPGSATATPRLTTEQAYAGFWAKVAPVTCGPVGRPLPPMRITADQPPDAAAHVGFELGVGRVVNLGPGVAWALTRRGWQGRYARFVLLHEWAHYYQQLGGDRTWEEVGADAWAYMLAPRLIPGYRADERRGWASSAPLAKVRWLVRSDPAWVRLHQFGC